MFELRLPKLAGNDHEQLEQLKSFLYQHISQLQFALDTLEKEIENIKRRDER